MFRGLFFFAHFEGKRYQYAEVQHWVMAMGTVRNRLREIRHELKIDYQADMAKLLGLSQYQYNRYERQKAQPTLEIAIKIAQKLNLQVEQIFYLDTLE